MLRPERQRLVDVGGQIGGALAGDPVDEIERDVVKVGITESVDRASDVVRSRLPFEYGEQPRLEALRAERDARHALLAQQRRKPRRDRLGIGLDGHLLRARQAAKQPLERIRLGEGRRSAAEEDGLEAVRASRVRGRAPREARRRSARGRRAGRRRSRSRNSRSGGRRTGGGRRGGARRRSLRPVQIEHGQEGLLRHLDRADLLHPLLAGLLPLEQLALRVMSPP